MSIYIVDSSIHQLAGDWVSNCIPDCTNKTIVSMDECSSLLSSNGSDYVILTGSEFSIFEDEPWIIDLLELIGRCVTSKIPLFGICFGHQAILRYFYGKDGLKRRRKPEVGWLPVNFMEHPVFQGLPEVIEPYIFHFDEAFSGKLPDFDTIAHSELCPCQAVVHRELPVVDVQFHPEINTENGSEGYIRESGLLKTFGVDLAEVLESSGRRSDLYYPEILSNFLDYY